MQKIKWINLLIAILVLLVPLSSRLNAQSPAAQTATTCTVRDGRVWVNGKPFFPLGFYHVSWAGDDNHKRAAVYRVAEAGFNIIHMALDMQDEALLDQAYELGLYVIIINDDPEGLYELMEKFKNHPAILGWNIGDDFSIPRKGYTPASIRAKHDKVKAISQSQCTYISSVTTYDVSPYMQSSDLMGIQVYPVPTDPLKRAFNNITLANQLAQSHGRPIIANAQAFAWSGYRTPTYAEIRNIAYQTLLARADGILFYTYFDPYWNFESHPELWRQMMVLASEIKMMMPMVLEGEFIPLTTNHPSVVAGMWLYNDEVTLIAANTSSTTAAQVSISLPHELITEPRVLFPTLSESFAYQNKVFTGTLQPVDVQILQAKR